MCFIGDGNLEPNTEWILQCLHQYGPRLVQRAIGDGLRQRTQFVHKEICDGNVAAAMPANNVFCLRK